MTNIYVQTHGCSANLVESEAMMGLLTESGLKIVDVFDAKPERIILPILVVNCVVLVSSINGMSLLTINKIELEPV